jgi:hypothetical protein
MQLLDDETRPRKAETKAFTVIKDGKPEPELEGSSLRTQA